MGSILVIRGGAIGDFVLTLPVLAALREQFPEARLEVLGYAHIATLATTGGLADAVRSIEAGPLAGFFAREGETSAELAAYFGGFDVIVSYSYDPDGIFRANVARCSKAQFIQGPHRPDELGQAHASAVFLQPLERLAIFEAEPVPRLTVHRGMAPAESSERARRRWLALHPGSGSERKNWPEESWAQLIGRLNRHTAWPVLLIGGEAEGDRLARLSQGLAPERFELARNVSLPELAVRLSECTAFVGHDSGISHLAAAVGLPGLVLWGDSTEQVWRPPSPRVQIVREAGGLGALTVERVFAAVRELYLGLVGSGSG